MENINFSYRHKQHEAIILRKDKSQKPNFVFLHGAGTGTKERILPVSDVLVENGFSIFTFDQTGAGKDSGNLPNASLEIRLDEAKYVIENFMDQNDLTICGASMGGYLAIKMLEYFPVKNLLLFCPALYTPNAFSLPFSAGFTHTIREHESWKNTDILPLLEKFKGKLLIVIGDQDKIVPKGVIDLIDNHTPNTRKKEIIWVPNAPHRIFTWLQDKPYAKHLADDIIKFLI